MIVISVIIKNMFSANLHSEFIYSFIHSGDLHSASSRHYSSEALPAQSRVRGSNSAGIEVPTISSRLTLPSALRHQVSGALTTVSVEKSGGKRAEEMIAGLLLSTQIKRNR